MTLEEQLQIGTTWQERASQREYQLTERTTLPDGTNWVAFESTTNHNAYTIPEAQFLTDFEYKAQQAA